VDLSAEARAGWDAMGRRTGGGYTAIAEVLGLAMGAAVKAGLRDKTWAEIAARISATAFERGRAGDT
jgi:hypothetical protein